MKPIKVYVSYEETHAGVIEENKGDGSPYSGWRHDRYNYRLKNAYLVCPSDLTPYWDDFVLKTDKVPLTVWVLYVRYGTGDTFSRSDGRGGIVSVHTDMQDAIANKKKIEGGTYSGKYMFWSGYFQSLESVHVEPLTVYG